MSSTKKKFVKKNQKPKMPKRTWVPVQQGQSKKAAGFLQEKTKIHTLETVPPEKRGTELAAELHAHGTDPRAAIVEKKSGVTSETVPNANGTINPLALMPYNNLVNLCLGIVLFSIERGWLATPGANPYGAFLYLFSAFSSVLTGTIPQIASAPEWYWLLVAALSPKNHRFKQATANYQWDTTFITGAVAPISTFEFGNVKVVLGATGINNVDGYPIIEPSLAQTPAQQEIAIQQLFKFYDEGGLCKILVSLPENHWIRHDISAFAMSYDEGEVSENSYGQYCTAYLESPLQCPLLAQFAPYQQQQSGYQWRGSLFTRRVSGTPGFIIPRMTEMEDSYVLKNKQFPLIKYFDFWEFFEVLSMIIGSALELANAVGSALVVPPCPLSAQNVQILLRQAMMNTFENAKLQDFTPGSGFGLVNYSVFSAGVNGMAYAQNVGNMALPQVFSENIRACKRKTVVLGNKQVLDFLPVLCQPTFVDNTGNQNISGGYTFYNGILGVQQSIYTPLVGEMRINIVDGSYGPVNPTGFVSFEGHQYTTYLNMWNQWINQLSAYLSSVTSLGTEQGAKALSVLFHTIIETQINDNTLIGKKKNPKDIPIPVKKVPPPISLGARILVDKHDILPDPSQLPESTYYQGVGLNDYTSNAPFVSSLWKYVKMFIMPVCHSTQMLYAGSGGFYQASMCEPYKVSVGANFIGPLNADNITITAYDRHLELAKTDVKAQLSEPSEFSVNLTQLLKDGHGGLFASIAGSIANIFVPGSGKVVDQIGSDLGL